MKRLHQIVGLVLLVLWVPITAHCTLENVPGLQFLKCGGDTEQKSDCDGDACTQLERATYKISETHISLLLPPLTALRQFLSVESPADEQPTAVIKTPPEISSAWQFSLRTALPPRAPSFVS